MIDWKAIGIYCIRNLDDSKNTAYIGSTTQNFKFRWQTHKSRLRGQRHSNSHLQRAWNKYGEDAFDFDVLEIVADKSIILDREKFWIDTLRCFIPLYNIGLVPGKEWSGRKMPKEIKERIRQATSGKNHYFYGQTHSDETKAKISLSVSGENNGFYGKKHTLESRQKMSKALQGKNHPQYGIPLTEKEKDVIREANSKEYPALKNLETGEIIPSGKNLSALCREREFTKSSMWKLIAGRIDEYAMRKRRERWILANKN